jgi:lipopolysaccharide export system protein LptC
MFPESLSISGAMIENGKVVMERPAISGRNKDGISYFMNARRALQDIINPNDLTLEDIKASMPVRGDLIARVEAKSAHFNRAKDMLDLSDPFTIRLTSGLTANFRSAHLDIDGGKMNTEEPVSITAKEASITADSLKMTDKGRVIVFYGHVRVDVDPAAIRAKDK